MKIIRNSAKCKKCQDEIESKHRHDFVRCKCGEIFVDGGKEYFRRGASDLENIIDTSVTL
jgi:Zn finger protein HypA/HybF involved in hydrogenase expression